MTKRIPAGSSLNQQDSALRCVLSVRSLRQSSTNISLIKSRCYSVERPDPLQAKDLAYMTERQNGESRIQCYKGALHNIMQEVFMT